MENGKVTTLEEFLALDKAKETIKQVEEILDKDAESVALIEEADCEEDMWDVFKKYITAPIEHFKEAIGAVTEYFKSDKVALSDETMDNVVGGWSFSNFWNKYKKVIIAATITVVASAAFVATAGAAIGCVAAAGAASTITAGAGAGIGALVGWCVGAVAGGGIYYKETTSSQK